MFLAFVDQGLEHRALRTEPESVVDHLGIAGHEIVLQVHGTPLERDAFHAAMGRGHDGPARSLIDAAALHAHEPVFQQIQPADAVGSAQLVQARQQSGR